INARRTAVWERGLKWSKRRPVAALVVALSLLAALGLTAGSIIHQHQEQLNKDRRIARVFTGQHTGLELLDEADKARTPEQLQQAQIKLATFLRDVKDESMLDQISARIDVKSNWVANQLRILSSNEATQKRDREDRRQFEKFLELWQEAQL